MPRNDLELFAREPTNRKAIASNLSAEKALLDRLASDADEDVRGNVAANPSTSIATLESLESDSNPRVRAQLAWNPSTPANILLNLAETVSDLASSYDRERLIMGWDGHLWGALASNPNSPISILLSFAVNDDLVIRQVAASAPRTPPEILLNLSKDKSSRVLVAVAKNASTPSSALTEILRLPKDSKLWGREDPAWAAARNPATPPAFLRDLVDKSHRQVHSAIAANPSSPVDALIVLGDLMDPPSDVLANLATNPSTPSELVDTLASNPDPTVRSSVTLNPVAPISTLRRLSTDMDSSVRAWTAESTRTPHDVIDHLASERNPVVSRSAVRNVNVPVATLMRLGFAEGFPGNSDHKSSLVDQLERLANLRKSGSLSTEQYDEAVARVLANG